MLSEDDGGGDEDEDECDVGGGDGVGVWADGDVIIACFLVGTGLSSWITALVDDAAVDSIEIPFEDEDSELDEESSCFRFFEIGGAVEHVDEEEGEGDELWRAEVTISMGDVSLEEQLAVLDTVGEEVVAGLELDEGATSLEPG